eukprot:scaffold20120_cov133-Cylindrotheca_fusiformis.AAC.4
MKEQQQQQQLLYHQEKRDMTDDQQTMMAHDRNNVLAQAIVRRIVHKCLDKYNNIHPPEEVEKALQYHSLPENLQQELVQKYGGPAPETWFQAVNRLKELSTSDGVLDKIQLWQLILDHPLTSYVPVQCQSCGQHVVSDVFSTAAEDEADGLSTEPPDGSEVGLRGGWFRGRPHPAKTVFRIQCPKCNHVSRWYRSGHPQIMLNPNNNWGRLCGEQEDLRLNLASYLGIPIRTCVPLDWDHVWSEYQQSNDPKQCTQSTNDNKWAVLDDSARNFAVRLDEGIGSWSRVLAVSPNPEWCGDVSAEYLSCHRSSSADGRADDVHAPNMKRYRTMVETATADPSGSSMQAKTCNGYVLHRAGWTAESVTLEMKRAAGDYGNQTWWQVAVDNPSS